MAKTGDPTDTDALLLEFPSSLRLTKYKGLRAVRRAFPLRPPWSSLQSQALGHLNAARAAYFTLSTPQKTAWNIHAAGEDFFSQPWWVAFFCPGEMYFVHCSFRLLELGLSIVSAAPSVSQPSYLVNQSVTFLAGPPPKIRLTWTAPNAANIDIWVAFRHFPSRRRLSNFTYCIPALFGSSQESPIDITNPPTGTMWVAPFAVSRDDGQAGFIQPISVAVP